MCSGSWRLYLLANIPRKNEAQRELKERYEEVLASFTNYATYFRKQRVREARENPDNDIPSMLAKHMWATLAELRALSDQGLPRFQELIHRAQTSHELRPLSNKDLEFATAFAIFYYYTHEVPCRPQCLKGLTLNSWGQLMEEGCCTTNNFKTKDKFGYQTLLPGEETLAVWAHWYEYIRPLCIAPLDRLPMAQLDSPFFVTVKGCEVSHICNLFKAYFRLVDSPLRITPTIVRMINATEANDRLTPAQARAIHHADTHTTATVLKHYDLNRSLRTIKQANWAYRLIHGESMAPSALAAGLEALRGRAANPSPLPAFSASVPFPAFSASEPSPTSTSSPPPSSSSSSSKRPVEADPSYEEDPEAEEAEEEEEETKRAREASEECGGGIGSVSGDQEGWGCALV